MEIEEPSDAANFKWTPEEIKCLIELYAQHIDEFENFKKNIVWNIIGQEITSMVNKTITGEQCLGKWKGLKAMYKKVLHDNSKRNRKGEKRRDWEHFEAMRAILCMQHEKDPLVWCPNDGLEDVNNSEEVDSLDIPAHFKWSPSDIKCLISLYTKHIDKFENLQKVKVWDIIAKEITSIRKKKFTSEQCNGKWKGLKAMYKKVLDHNNKRGNEKRDWPFFDDMHEVFWMKPEYDTLISYSSDMEDAEETLSDSGQFEWSSGAINFLIGLYLKHKNKIESIEPVTAWDIIAQEITYTYGEIITSNQCISKWKELESIYTHILDHNNSGRNGKMNWEHYDAMREALSTKPEINLPATSSSYNIEVVNNNTEHNEIVEENESVSRNKRKTCDIDDPRERRHREKMAKMDQFLDLFKTFVDHITRRDSVTQ